MTRMQHDNQIAVREAPPLFEAVFRESEKAALRKTREQIGPVVASLEGGVKARLGQVLPVNRRLMLGSLGAALLMLVPMGLPTLPGGLGSQAVAGTAPPYQAPTIVVRPGNSGNDDAAFNRAMAVGASGKAIVISLMYGATYTLTTSIVCAPNVVIQMNGATINWAGSAGDVVFTNNKTTDASANLTAIGGRLYGNCVWFDWRFSTGTNNPNAGLLATYRADLNNAAVTIYPSFSPFGINGGYYYARASFKF